ncbi:MAG: iron-sulfur cluster assembly scaffold protein [Actinobacteria bacterium]|nr:iron-sulfur cluster assembly scaffold protein [Actinomycetota bacterium]
MKSTQYSEKTLDHFRNPRNVGVLEGDDVAVGRVGNPVCGDLMEMYVRVKDDRIDDIKFQTFGCGSAIATSSMITELVMGKTLDEALEVTRADVADALDGLPPVKMHCSNLAADALHDAIKNWRSGKRLEPLGADEIAAAAKGCSSGATGETTVIQGTEDYAGKGVYASVADVTALADKRVLVLDKGVASARLALELTRVTPRVIFLTELDALALPDELASEIKRSDVKMLFQSRLLAVRGEGEVEKVLVHDLDEDSDYELFVDAVVLLED